MKLEEKVGTLLKEKGLKLAIAESTTGGLTCHRIVSVPGSSRYFDRGVVAYSKDAKAELVDVPLCLLDEFGTVSSQVARAMAEGIKRKSRVDLGLAETGIAGPIPRRSSKPVGATYIALATPSETFCEEFHFSGGRQAILEAISRAALEMLLEYLIRA